ncbi:MAG: DUF4268 domain-containing protein [Bryobacteraceae bacterium]
MALFELTNQTLVQVPETRFDSEVLKSKDLQRLLRQDISVLSGDLKVLAQDYGNWEDSNLRIDLLCLDKEANLVIVQIKSTAEPGYIDLQAIRSAAMISAMTFEEAVAAAARDPLVPATPIEEIREEILDFLDWNTPEEGEFAPTIRIILASSDFSRDLTQSVIWLNDQGLDVRCIRLRPHKLADERVLLNVEQILPLPEADAYQTSITKLGQLEKLRISGQQQRRRRFLGELWQTGLKITRLHENQRPTIQYSSIFVRLRPGISLSYIIRKADSRVELHVQRGERTDAMFHYLQSHRAEIEQTYGRPLHWRERRERKLLRVQEVIEGGFLSPDESWPSIHEKLVDAMIRLDKAVRPLLQQF